MTLSFLISASTADSLKHVYNCKYVIIHINYFIGNITMPSAATLKQKLLDEGEAVLMSIIEAAKDGNSRHPNAHAQSSEKVWNALIPILQNTAEKAKISAQTTQDVLKLLKDGSLSISEAKEMVALLAMVEGRVGTPEDNNKIIIEIAQGVAT